MTPSGFGLDEKIEKFDEEESPLNFSIVQKNQPRLSIAYRRSSVSKISPLKKSDKGLKDDGFCQLESVAAVRLEMILEERNDGFKRQ